MALLGAPLGPPGRPWEPPGRSRAPPGGRPGALGALLWRSWALPGAAWVPAGGPGRSRDALGIDSDAQAWCFVKAKCSECRRERSRPKPGCSECRRERSRQRFRCTGAVFRKIEVLRMQARALSVSIPMHRRSVSKKRSAQNAGESALGSDSDAQARCFVKDDMGTIFD